MKSILLSMLSMLYLFGATEITKHPSTYEDHSTEKSNSSEEKIKPYQMRIVTLKLQLDQTNKELSRLKKQNTEIERELTQKSGVIQSLEKTLNNRDKGYRDAVNENDRLLAQTNREKVSRIERQKLTSSLEKTKLEVQQLENSITKVSKEKIQLVKELNDAKALAEKYKNSASKTLTNVPSSPKITQINDQSDKIKALQVELAHANEYIQKLQTMPSSKERIVTKIVEPTDKITALERELSAAQTKIAILKNNSSSSVVKEKIIEKVVYKDRPVIQEKIIEKVVLKSNDATEKLNRALQQKLAENEAQTIKLKEQSRKLIPPKMMKTATQGSSIPEKTKNSTVSEFKTPIAVTNTPMPKKGGSSAYRISGNAPIYNSPGGSKIDTWEDRRSFTAGSPSGGWVHITGYFVNRVWQPTTTEENLWVKESDVIRR